MASLCICDGVIRSGSTWVFNVCRALYRYAQPQLAEQMICTYLDARPLEQLINYHLAGLKAPAIIKTHLPGQTALRAILSGRARAVCSYRDPRDCVASDLMFMGGEFENSLKRISGTFALLRLYRSTPSCLLVRYEGMMSDRLGQIRRIVEHLGLQISEEAICRIDDKTNLQTSEQICAGLKNAAPAEVLEGGVHRVDPSTQLHDNHLHGGTIGRWKHELSQEQIDRLNLHFGPWLVELGYEAPAQPPSTSPQTSASAAHNDLGVELAKAGLLDEAVVEFRRALQLSPDDPQVNGNLGIVLLQMNRHGEAVGVCRIAALLQPASGQAWCNLGVALRGTGQAEQAIEAYTRAIALMPESAETHMNLGIALDAAGRRENALEAYRRAIAIDPMLANAHYNLANALSVDDEAEAAVAAYRRAIEARENFVAAHSNLGKALMRLGQVDEAIGAYNRAIELDPQSAHPHWNRSLALLLQGNFEQGLAEYEWRDRPTPSGSHPSSASQWNGGALNGRTILLIAEHGLGDAVQMVRYVPLVSAAGGRVILQCHRELIELFRSLPGIHQLLSHDDPLPAFDVYCPLMSLPRAFGTRLNSIPATVPYLVPDLARVETWRDRLAPTGGPRVGLVWAGAPEHQYDRQRSIRLGAFAPLLRMKEAQFFSLQKGAAAEQVKTLPAGCELIDHTQLLGSYADTAALISQMDLVISVDTSVAHVAAAMGKPVWMLVAFAPDWRWLLKRSDSPWYPTMRLFRQEIRNDWTWVMQQAAEALVAWI